MVLLVCMLICKIKNTLDILETAPHSSKIHISYLSDNPTILVLTLDKKIFPYLFDIKKQYDFKLIDIVKKKKYTHYILYNNSYKKIKNLILETSKLLSKVWDYGSKDERGLEYRFLVLDKNGILFKSRQPIFDISVVPDFTVPFLAINIFSWVFALTLGIFVKKALAI